MSLATINSLVPPPESPVEVGTKAGWKEVEMKLGLKLPADYRKFIDTYGSGLFADFYIIYNPFAAS